MKRHTKDVYVIPTVISVVALFMGLPISAWYTKQPVRTIITWDGIKQTLFAKVSAWTDIVLLLALTAAGYLIYRAHERYKEAQRENDANLALVEHMQEKTREHKAALQTIQNNEPKRVRPPKVIHTIGFGYLPRSPLENGWTQAYESDGLAEFCTDPDIPGSLRMKILKSKVAIDHTVPPHATLADTLEFTAKYTNTANPTMIFTRLTVGNQDDSLRKYVFVNYAYGELRAVQTYPNPNPGRDPNRWMPEQTLFLPAEVLPGGTLAFKIDLQKVVSLSIGAQGWEFKSIDSIRLRGNLSISPIVVSKTRET